MANRTGPTKPSAGARKAARTEPADAGAGASSATPLTVLASLRARLIALAVICVLAVGGTVAFVLNSKHKHDQRVRNAPSVATTDLARVQSGPRIVFRTTALGTTYGRLAMVSLADPTGPRAISEVSCDRVYSTTVNSLCLSSDRGLTTTYKAEVLDQGLQGIRNLPLAGIPSRARLSADGKLAATTSFTAGDSYASTSYSTRTVITELDSSGAELNLEDFTLIKDGRTIKPTDRNFWGVTFGADGDTFYATVATGHKTYLIKGSIGKKTLTTLHEDAECPSLSPDGKTIVYKKRDGLPIGRWRLAGYDVATGRETRLAETRTVDDQVEWLDNASVLYGLPRAGSQASIDDVWSVPSNGSGAPKVVIEAAWSPAVIR